MVLPLAFILYRSDLKIPVGHFDDILILYKKNGLEIVLANTLKVKMSSFDHFL